MKRGFAAGAGQSLRPAFRLSVSRSGRFRHLLLGRQADQVIERGKPGRGARAHRDHDLLVGHGRRIARREDARHAGLAARIDLDLADSAGTAGRYGALIDILNRQLQLNELVLTEIR